MTKNIQTSSITIRCPSTLLNSIDTQVKQTKQNKTDVMIGMLLSSIPSLHITERAKLPSQAGIYFVYTPDHQLLYLDKADNLNIRWNSHHKYQYFIESSTESRIGYFTFNTVEELNQTIEEFELEPTKTTESKALVTADQFEKLKQQLATVKKQLNDSSLAKHFGFNTISDLENAAALFEIDPIEYLEELSGWQNNPIGEGSSQTKFFPQN